MNCEISAVYNAPVRHKPFPTEPSWSELPDRTSHSSAQSLSGPSIFRCHSRTWQPSAAPQQWLPTSSQHTPMIRLNCSAISVSSQTYDHISTCHKRLDSIEKPKRVSLTIRFCLKPNNVSEHLVTLLASFYWQISNGIWTRKLCRQQFPKINFGNMAYPTVRNSAQNLPIRLNIVEVHLILSTRQNGS